MQSGIISDASRKSLFGVLIFCFLGAVILSIGQSSFPPEKKDFRIPSIGMEMVFLKDGQFLMGDRYEFNHFKYSDNWQPVTVTLTNGFWIGKYEVTQGEFRKIMKDYPIQGDDCLPATNIGWRAAVWFCNQLTEIEKKAGRMPDGYVYRLPTDAEWEYACRAGTRSRFSFGDDPKDLGNYAWFESNSDMSIHRVGLKEPNPWGLFDMYGNVSEICLDAYNHKYDEETRFEEDPLNRPDGGCILVRGAAFDSYEDQIASSCRYWDGMYYYSDLRWVGFRIVLAPKPPEYEKLLDLLHLFEQENLSPKDK